MPGRNAHGPPQAQEGSGRAGCWPGACHAPILPNTTPEPCGCSAPSHDVARKGWRAVPALPPPRTRNPGLRRGAGGGSGHGLGLPVFSPWQTGPHCTGLCTEQARRGCCRGPSHPAGPSGHPAPPRPECQPLCPAEAPQESGHCCQGLVAGTPWGSCQHVSSAPATCLPAALGLGSCLSGHPLPCPPPHPRDSPTSCPAPLCPALLGAHRGLHAVSCPGLCLQPSGGPLPHPHSLPQATRL